MSQTADQPSADQTPGDVPPHRYTPALAAADRARLAGPLGGARAPSTRRTRPAG